jgi:alginate O-acetyltransferase complex protein AlgI
VLFSSPDYPLFLGAVFFLYGMARSRGHLGAASRIALMLLLGDLLFLLVAKRPETLWDPVGGVLFTLLAGSAERGHELAPWWQYVSGAAVLAAGVAWGRRRGQALAGDGVQRRLAFALSAACVAVGAAVALASVTGTLAELTAGFAAFGHLLYLALLAFALGASLEPAPSSAATSSASPSLAFAATAGAAGSPPPLVSTTTLRPIGALLILFSASSLFYLAWCVAMHGAYRYLLALLFATIVLDYYLGLAIERSEGPARRKLLLVVSLVSNLGVLAIFKYADFFLLDVLRLPVEPLGLILPAGISFHTFQSLSYTIDVYRKEVRATSSVLEFATFVLFFPQLVAGPIVRAKDLLPQLGALPPFDHQRALDGLFRIACGLWKKIALADTLAIAIVDGVFAAPERFSSVEVAAAVAGYALQIYLDFSAYSDIALGSAQLLGFTLPENFHTPYRSSTLQEFWRRWHMSLSTWLRDYLYIPLGGSRGGQLATYRNLLATMLLGGLWHGASWTFVVWGGLHGGGLAVARVFEERLRRGEPAWGRALLVALVIAAVGAGAHVALDANLEALGGSMSGWADLALSWLYLTPLWAGLTVALAHTAQTGAGLSGPGSASGSASGAWPRRAVTSRARSLARLCRLAMAGLTLGLLLALRHGDPQLWVALVVAILLAATVAAGLDAGWVLSRVTALRALCRCAASLLVVTYVLIAWVFFRATSFDNALEIFRRLGAFELDHANVGPLVTIALAAATASHLFPDRTFAWLRDRFLALTPAQQGVVLAANALILRELANPRIVPFIYFQF